MENIIYYLNTIFSTERADGKVLTNKASLGPFTEKKAKKLAREQKKINLQDLGISSMKTWVGTESIA